MSERWLWTQKEDIGPNPRTAHAMAYDAARERVVLFGGYGLTGVSGSTSGVFSDTWEWDGNAWTQVADTGPSARAEIDMAYDSARQRVVLFGGGSLGLDDTWEWNGTEWTQLADTGPPPRWGYAMSYDAVSQRVVVFGGSANISGMGTVYYNDTWEWDGSEWTQVADSGPSRRRRHAMVFDSSRKCLVLFGGGEGYHRDTWEWSDARWTKRQDIGPQAIVTPKMAYTGERTVLFGGRQGEMTKAGQTWDWDGRLWTQRQDMGPTTRNLHALTYDSGRDRVVLFGGSTDKPTGGNQTQTVRLGDTWELAIIEQ